MECALTSSRVTVDPLRSSVNRTLILHFRRCDVLVPPEHKQTRVSSFRWVPAVRVSCSWAFETASIVHYPSTPRNCTVVRSSTNLPGLRWKMRTLVRPRHRELGCVSPAFVDFAVECRRLLLVATKSWLVGFLARSSNFAR